MATLMPGQDFRLARYRREVFLRFYEFHLRYGTHPGCVYLLMPSLAESEGWSLEERLWFAFINGNTQNPVTSWLIFRAFPSVRGLDLAAFTSWFASHYDDLAFDTDRRYHKKEFVQAVACYLGLTEGGEQAAYFQRFEVGSPEQNFDALWPVLMREFHSFGRLSAYSYAEYLAISGVPVQCSQLFLEDQSGSRSHRNGLCKVLGRDDLDWHASNPGFNGDYSLVLPWLVEESAALLDEARARTLHPHAGYFTLESALCTFKSWHRPNRRYANCYADMLHDRIVAGERAHGPLPVFWAARKALPAPLRLESNPGDPGCVPAKQNVYRETGQIVMMEHDWPCFASDFGARVRRLQGSA